MAEGIVPRRDRFGECHGVDASAQYVRTARRSVVSADAGQGDLPVCRRVNPVLRYLQRLVRRAWSVYSSVTCLEWYELATAGSPRLPAPGAGAGIGDRHNDRPSARHRPSVDLTAQTAPVCFAVPLIGPYLGHRRALIGLAQGVRTGLSSGREELQWRHTQSK
jgi:hypothetical protein